MIHIAKENRFWCRRQKVKCNSVWLLPLLLPNLLHIHYVARWWNESEKFQVSLSSWEIDFVSAKKFILLAQLEIRVNVWLCFQFGFALLGAAVVAVTP